MTSRSGSTVLWVIASLLVVSSPATAQDLLKMRVLLGVANELEVDVEYHDPSELDARLKGSRVIPVWLSAKNVSSRPLRLDYGDVLLDLGSSGGGKPIRPIEADQARAQLRKDGNFNALLSLLASQGNRYVGEPFSRRLPDGHLSPGRSKSGYVFFLRPDGVFFTGFMAIGTANSSLEALRTKTFEVRSPDKESSQLWDLTWVRNGWQRIWYGDPPYNKSYALLLGVSRYRFQEPLPLVQADLKKMEDFLVARGFHVLRVQDEKLTIANVRSPQDYFERKILPNDRLLVYFAGHGFHRAEGGDTRGYLTLINAMPQTVSRTDTIAMDEFVAWTMKVTAKHLLVILDACFSGLAVKRPDFKIEVRGGPDPPPVKTDPAALYRLAAAPGRYLVMAGNAEQKSIGNLERWKGGLFTQGIVVGFGGAADRGRDGFVTTRELYPWLRDFVEAEADKVGQKLTPLIKDLGTYGASEGEFVFAAPK